MPPFINTLLTEHADHLNGTLEFLGSLFTFNNCRILFKDKCVRGYSALTVLFFFSWGVWNTIWYPFLHQHWSFIGGIFIAIANATYLSLMLYYRHAYDPEADQETFI